MGNIVLLDELTINKIAAGEVIERPASVIKEMVENSIDAGATSINVEIKNGGISYIRITDNGKGIARDDMEMAFERHATSKIRNAEDLNQVKSMGFRGEALASIAAIANVEMVSKTIDDEVGSRIVVEAGKVLTFGETGCQVGTIITVQNLFFNTPVRYKFLKKDYTETGYIEDTITRLSLIHPEIAFRLINSGKTIIQTSGNGKIQDVIYSIYGKDIASSILNVDYTYEEMHITGVVGKPEIARSNRSNQIFFVNKRFVKDKTLTGATENSFKGLLPIGKYGFLILNIDMDPARVDVNVHPAKLEVRFQEESKVFKAVYHAIRDTLLKAELIANTEKTIEQTYNTGVTEHTGRTSITDLFRKISKSQENEESKNSLIEDIYNKKQEIKEQNVKLDHNQETTNNTENINEDIHKKQKMDVFNELLAMQRKLKEEVENNPNLQTNIDKIMENTRNLGMTNNVEEPQNKVTYSIQEENEEKSIYKIREDQAPYEVKEAGIIEENSDEKEALEDTEKITFEEEAKKETGLVEETQVMQEIKPNKMEKEEISIVQKYLDIKNQETETDEKEELPIETQYLQKTNEQELPKEEEKNNTEEVENTIASSTTQIPQETRKFTSEEIEEMMDKLEKIENVENSPEFSNMYEKIFGKLPESVEAEKRKEEEKISAYELIKDNNISVFDSVEELKKPVYKLVGIAFNTYIIIEIAQELYIIDQHAAHERVMYEKVKENYYSDSGKESQMLLLPDIITLTHKEVDILKDNYEMFEKAGFALEEFGENTIKLMGVPNICLELDTKELFLETLDEINQVARTAKQEIEEKFIATVACKAAVKANMNLTPEEVDSLMNELLKLPNPFTCPHGRPTAIKMDKNDLEKKFARRK